MSIISCRHCLLCSSGCLTIACLHDTSPRESHKDQWKCWLLLASQNKVAFICHSKCFLSTDWRFYQGSCQLKQDESTMSEIIVQKRYPWFCLCPICACWCRRSSFALASPVTNAVWRVVPPFLPDAVFARAHVAASSAIVCPATARGPGNLHTPAKDSQTVHWNGMMWMWNKKNKSACKIEHARSFVFPLGGGGEVQKWGVCTAVLTTQDG